ncbi:MAG TPA: hypothetical protein VFD64_07045 [Gemmatimonadaceae bacterium]|nr:hypothetical protein [Gemmatimonadaceae bacterium]
MFSCLGRLGCLLLLVLAGAVAFLMRDRWMPRVLGRGEPAPVTWETVKEPGAGTQKTGDDIASLGRPNGPAYVTVSAAELAELMVASSGHRLPANLDSVEAAVDSETVRVRALVELEDLRGLDALGPLASILDKRERIEFTGTMGVLRPGLGEFRVASVKIADLSLPRAAIPRLLARLDASVRPEGVAPNGIAISIPEYIGDVRVSRGEITLYRRGR